MRAHGRGGAGPSGSPPVLGFRARGGTRSVRFAPCARTTAASQMNEACFARRPKASAPRRLRRARAHAPGDPLGVHRNGSDGKGQRAEAAGTTRGALNVSYRSGDRSACPVSPTSLGKPDPNAQSVRVGVRVGPVAGTWKAAKRAGSRVAREARFVFLTRGGCSSAGRAAHGASSAADPRTEHWSGARRAAFPCRPPAPPAPRPAQSTERSDPGHPDPLRLSVRNPSRPQPAVFTGILLNGIPRSARMSAGSPSTRSAMMLRRISSVPPSIRVAGERNSIAWKRDIAEG